MDPECYVRGGLNLGPFFIFFVLIDEIREDQNATKKQVVIDLLAKRYLNGLRADNSPTLYASLVAM